MPRETDLYLYDILEIIENICQYTKGLTYEDFISNRMCVDAGGQKTGNISITHIQPSVNAQV